MIKKIRAHNEVNGFWFSAVEFTIMALIILPFALYYFAHGRPVAGLVAIGIVANCLTPIPFAIRSLMVHEHDIGVLQWFNQGGRAIIASRFPNITNDTLVLTVAMLIPFSVVLSTLYERLRPSAKL